MKRGQRDNNNPSADLCNLSSREAGRSEQHYSPICPFLYGKTRIGDYSRLRLQDV